MDLSNIRLKNAERLLADANLLYDNCRWASAYALALYALEEVGRVIIEEWTADAPLPRTTKKQTFHVQKQLAVFHLVLAESVLANAKAMEEEGAEPPKASHEEAHPSQWLRQLRKRMTGTEEFGLYHSVQDGWLERSKHLTLYRDASFLKEGMTPDDITANDPVRIERITLKALPMIYDNDLMSIARVNYEWAISGKNSPRESWWSKRQERRQSR